MLSTFEIRVTSCRNVLEPEQIEAVPQQFEALESRFVSCDVLANVPTSFVNLSSLLFGKAFRLQPDCERVSDFAAQQHRPSKRM